MAAAPVAIRAAPVFPSLIEEGKVGGFDVHLPFVGFPLFLQFKLSHRMVRNSAAEVKNGLLTTPFYRMHLRPSRHSQQHALLLTLEATGAAVYYAAPYFHRPSELDSAYTSRQVVQRSIFVKPSEIGALPDDKDHHLSFRRGRPCYFCSESARVIRDAELKPAEFLRELADGFWKRERLEPTEESTNAWADRISEVIRSRGPLVEGVSTDNLDALRSRDPVTRLAYLARTFLGCSVVLIAPVAAEDGASEV